VLAVAAAGVALVLAAGLGVVAAAAAVALGDVFALAFVLRCGDFWFFAAGVALAAGCSAEVFGVAAGGVFRFDGAFFSGFVAAGDSFVAAGDSVAPGSFVAGASVFGGRVGLGFNSAGAFFSGALFLPGDSCSSGDGC
jgi:hypothetical protein